VMLKQADEVLGQACWCEPELQFPHAPCPVAAQGPQALPQQNHEASPKTAVIRSSLRWDMT
jgi:hypothetical protein